MSYEEKKQRIAEVLKKQQKQGHIRLRKDTSNLFRDRKNGQRAALDVRDFNTVLHINAEEKWVEVEGMTTYEDLVAATLPYGLMPAVVPQLKSITIGGAVSGIGIESSSFKYGLPHETIFEVDVLLGDGDVVTCTPGNNHQDLFFGLPNSYGTLGYILKLKAMLIPTKPYVSLQHIRHTSSEDFFADLDQRREQADFLDGTVFAPDELYLTVGQFVDQVPYTSDYTYENIYYHSIRQKPTDYLTTHDYIWRWDTDWFWCSKHILAQNPLVRRLLGKQRLNSVTYSKVMRWNSGWGLTRRLYKLLGYRTESVIQDVDIPIQHAPEFLRFFHREIGILPVWICPFKNYHPDRHYLLFANHPDTLYVNFGFWDVIKNRERHHPQGYYNRKIEHKVQELGGIKSLYSDAYFAEDEFWLIYNKPAFDQLKARYDPGGVFKNLYQKTVQRH